MTPTPPPPQDAELRRMSRKLKSYEKAVQRREKQLIEDRHWLDLLTAHRTLPHQWCRFGRWGWTTAFFLALYVLYMHSAFFGERQTLWPEWKTQADQYLATARNAELDAIRSDLAQLRHEWVAWQIRHTPPPERQKWTRPRWGMR